MTARLRYAFPRSWHGYWRLPPADRSLARRSWVLLGVSALLLKFLRLQTVVTLVARLVPIPARQPVDPDLMRRAEHMAALFVTVANLHLLPTTCLPRAVALWWLLRESDIAAEIVLGIVLGVQPVASAVTAHAWVETAGQVVGDPQQTYLAYSTILTRYPKRQ